MSVYHVYTKSAQIPIFVLYECPKCKSIVTTTGVYDVSVSYSDRGATRKRFGKRQAAAIDQLVNERNAQSDLLRREATPVHHDYQKVKCKCPKCGHASLSKITNQQKLAFYLSIAIVAIFWIVYLIKGTTQQSIRFEVGALIGGIFLSLVAVGLISMFLEWVLNQIIKAQVAALCRKATPMICSNRDILMEEAKRMPAYKDADFSNIMNFPVFLDTTSK